MGTFNIVHTDQIMTGAVGEKITEVTPSASITYNYSLSGVFLHNAAASQNWTANITNVPEFPNTTYTVAIICSSNATAAYSPTAYTVNGLSLTPLGSIPTTDAASKIKIIVLTLVRNSSNVLSGYLNAVVY